MKSKKTAPKKAVVKAKPAYGVWFEHNFPKGVMPAPRTDQDGIEQYYEDILYDWDQTNNESHLIKFDWSVIGGHPPVYHLVGKISPPPEEIPNPPPTGGSTTPPSPPPPPPPSLQ